MFELTSLLWCLFLFLPPLPLPESFLGPAELLCGVVAAVLLVLGAAAADPLPRSLFPLPPFAILEDWRGGGRCRRRRPNTEVRTECPTLHYVQSSEREAIPTLVRNRAQSICFLKRLRIAKWEQPCRNRETPVFSVSLNEVG